MERTPHKSHLLCFAVTLFLTIACSGCGKPMLYHFRHYHRPFAAIAKSNQTYFHSQQTGRIIEKDPCGEYCEPGCYGFEPTTWTHWPTQCPGNFPVQGEEAVEAMSYGAPLSGDEAIYSYGESVMGSGVVSDGTIIEAPAPPTTVPATDGANLPSYPGNQTLPRTDRRLPIHKFQQGTTIPTDNESAIPSPSDATHNRLPAPKGEVPNPAIASGESFTDKPQSSEKVASTAKASPNAASSNEATSLAKNATSSRDISLRMNRPVLNRPVLTRIGFDGSEDVSKPVRVADKLSNLRGTVESKESPSLSSKLFSVREFEQPTKIQVEKPSKIQTKPLAKKVEKGPAASKQMASKRRGNKPIKVIPPRKVEPKDKSVAKATKVLPPKAVKPVTKTQTVDTGVAKKSVAKKTVAKKTVATTKSKTAATKTAAKEAVASKTVLSQPEASPTVASKNATNKPEAGKLTSKVVSKSTLVQTRSALKTPTKKNPALVKSPVKTAIPITKHEPKGSRMVIRDRKTTKDVAKAGSAKLRPKQGKPDVMTMKVTDYGNSTVKFATEPLRKPIRVSAVSDDQPAVRFR